MISGESSRSSREVNDERKKKKPVTEIGSSSQSSILDNKPERFTNMSGGKSSKSSREVNDERKKKKPVTEIGSSSQSSILDNKPERFTNLISGESSRSSREINDETHERKKKKPVTVIGSSSQSSIHDNKHERSTNMIGGESSRSSREINDERKKKKPATVIGSSSQSSIHDNKPERSTNMIGGESSRSSREINDERKKKKPVTEIGSSSQSSIIDNKPETFTNTIGGESSRSSCGICFDFVTDSDMFKRNRCNHLYCVDCISKYVDSQINNNVVKVTCPTPNCLAKLEPRHLQNIMPKEFIDRWEIGKYESRISLEQKIYCPFKNCSVLLVNDNDRREVVTSCECPACHRLFCAQCKVPWHAEMNCWEFQNLKRDKNEQDLDDKFLGLAIRKKWQRCPNCSMIVNRRSGCEHMECRCKCSFCYHCGKKWKSGHICK